MSDNCYTALIFIFHIFKTQTNFVFVYLQLQYKEHNLKKSNPEDLVLLIETWNLSCSFVGKSDWMKQVHWAIKEVLLYELHVHKVVITN